jgi:hypothetical protein
MSSSLRRLCLLASFHRQLLFRPVSGAVRDRIIGIFRPSRLDLRQFVRARVKTTPVCIKGTTTKIRLRSTLRANL